MLEVEGVVDVNPDLGDRDLHRPVVEPHRAAVWDRVEVEVAEASPQVIDRAREPTLSIEAIVGLLRVEFGPVEREVAELERGTRGRTKARLQLPGEGIP